MNKRILNIVVASGFALSSIVAFASQASSVFAAQSNDSDRISLSAEARGRGSDDLSKLTATRTPEMGDDHGVDMTKTPEIGDDHGVDATRTPEVGDDHGTDATKTPEVGDDHGGDKKGHDGQPTVAPTSDPTNSGPAATPAPDDHKGKDGPGHH